MIPFLNLTKVREISQIAATTMKKLRRKERAIEILRIRIKNKSVVSIVSAEGLAPFDRDIVFIVMLYVHG